MKIDIQDVPHVALDFMNSDHEAFVVLFNELAGLLPQPDLDRGRVSTLFAELLQHCREHFAREEEQMETHSFPAYSCHKSEHQHVLAEMEKELAAWQTKGDVQWLSDYLDQLPEWLANHVASMDTVTASYISQVGGAAEAR
ncbi:bacteriohemerythrin [Pseudomonadota bacterium]